MDNNNYNGTSVSGGISLGSLGSLGTILFIVFLILKLTGVISWSWWWVTAPLWIPIGFALLLLLILGVLVFINHIKN